MSSRKLGSIACMLVAFAGLDVAAQRAASIPPDITGAYERYGNIFGPRTEAQQKDPTIPPPNPPPPLKPEYLKQWQARVQAAREAEAKGQPLATGYTHCLPDGMPSMMAAMFPIEFLQSKGQVTVIEEAFTQIRRILLMTPEGHRRRRAGILRSLGRALGGRHAGGGYRRDQRGSSISERAALQTAANQGTDSPRCTQHLVERDHDGGPRHAREAVDRQVCLSTDAGLHAPRVHLRRQPRIRGRAGTAENSDRTTGPIELSTTEDQGHGGNSVLTIGHSRKF